MASNEAVYVVQSQRPAGKDSHGADLTQTKQEGEYPTKIAAFSAAGEIAARDGVVTVVSKREWVCHDTEILWMQPTGREML